eukprot:6574055-Ditylum_brightwellii.AAC.1
MKESSLLSRDSDTLRSGDQVRTTVNKETRQPENMGEVSNLFSDNIRGKHANRNDNSLDAVILSINSIVNGIPHSPLHSNGSMLSAGSGMVRIAGHDRSIGSGNSLFIAKDTPNIIGLSKYEDFGEMRDPVESYSSGELSKVPTIYPDHLAKMQPRNENAHYAVLVGIGDEGRDLPDEPTKSNDSILSAGGELIKSAFSDMLENFIPGQPPQGGNING